MPAKLKVFVTSDGLTDYVVATSSKVKALAAWGSHQDLFKTGLARQTDDPELVRSATAQPEQVLRRPAGSRDELAKPRPRKAEAPRRPAGPSKAALKKVRDLERRLEAADAAHAKTLEELDRRRREADEKAAAQRARLEAQLKAARRALES